MTAEKNMKILISHAVEDEPAATALKDLLRRCSLQKIDVWFSSDRSARGGMPIGGMWFNELHEKLRDTDWIVALVTPNSITSPWLYFECGFGASNRSQSVIPVTLGLPVSSAPMPLAAYQIYDAANAISLATFLQKLLEANGVIYDEELTLGLRESTQKKMIAFQEEALSKANQIAQPQSTQDEIAALKSFIEQRFIDLYEVIPTERRPALDFELHFDASEITGNDTDFKLNVPVGYNVMDVLTEIYFRIEEHVPPLTYLVNWTIADVEDQSKHFSIIEIAESVPANLLFKSNRKYKLKSLKGGDSYLKRALRCSLPGPS